MLSPLRDDGRKFECPRECIGGEEYRAETALTEELMVLCGYVCVCVREK